jgi:serine protease Do
VACALAALAVARCPPAQAQTGDDLHALEAVLPRAIARAAPSIVRVETFGGARPAPERDPGAGLVPPGFVQARGASTGLILSADGWIAVARFALSFDPTTILVTLDDGRVLNAVRHGEDTSCGIALVKVAASGLPVPELLAEAEVAVGQWALALGRTFGQTSPTVHLGIVSAKGRIFGRAVQIDANTSPANYGGPVVDLEGRVLGLAVPLSPSGRDTGADWYDSGIGFAATLAGVGPRLERLKAGATLHRAWLGVGVDAAFDGPGAKLAEVARASPGAAAGLDPGDVIERVDGAPVRHRFHLQALIGGRYGGDTVLLGVRRGESAREVSVRLDDLPAEQRAPEAKEGDEPLPSQPGR